MNEDGVKVCDDPLSGTTTDPSSTIKVHAIQDNDSNSIGIQMKTLGSESGKYL